MSTSAGYLLDGQLSYTQPARGYRTGIEPVLLAASIPARAGQTVLELGTGAGAALLCLARRLPLVRGVGVERDATMADLARGNVAANGFADRVSILTADVTSLPGGLRFDHACANPPWHDPASTASPNASKAAAKQSAAGELARWTAAMAQPLARRGTLTLILPAGLLAEGITAIGDAGCGAVVLMPLWPAAGKPARLILLQAIKDAAGPSGVLPGLVLHRAGGYTESAEAILRAGQGSALADVQA